jgi:hypothetical protein
MKKKNIFIIEQNFTKKKKKNSMFLIMRRVWLVRLFPVTVADGIDVHVNASYFQTQAVRQLQLVSKFGFHSYHCRKSNFTDVRRWERQQYLQSFSRKSWTRLLNRQPELCQFSAVRIQFNGFKNFSRPTTNRLATHQFGKRWPKVLSES